MTAHLQFRMKRFSKSMAAVTARRVRRSLTPDQIEIIDGAPYTFDAPGDDGDWQPMSVGQEWGGREQFAYFRAQIDVPADWPADRLELHLSTDRNFPRPAVWR
jgi:hypothetical protein